MEERTKDNLSDTETLEEKPEIVEKETTDQAQSSTVIEAIHVPDEIVNEMGVIAQATKITGDISTQGHLTILGEVEGNISANGNVIVKGRITGDISCDNLEISGCEAKTNLNVKHSVTIDEGTRVEGQISCGKIAIDGIVIGDIEAKNEINIYQNARVKGSIKTKALGIETGAQLEGSVMVVK